MASSSSSSSSISNELAGSSSEIPIIILDSDDSDDGSDDDVQIIEVRNVRKRHRSEGTTSSDRTSSIPTDAGSHHELTSPEPKREVEEALKPEPKETLKRELEEPTSPIPNKRQRAESPGVQITSKGWFRMEKMKHEHPYVFEESRKAQIREGLFDEDDLPPYTRRFFIDLADTIAITFPIVTFAMQHDCSPGEVSRALSALVVSPLMDPSLHELVQEGESSIEDYGRMMIEIWHDRYRRMVSGEDTDVGKETNMANTLSYLEEQKYMLPNSSPYASDLLTSGDTSFPVNDPPKSSVQDTKTTVSSLSSSETLSALIGSPQQTQFATLEKSNNNASTERHWIERDAFGIYVKSESAQPHPLSVEFEGEIMFGAGMKHRERVKSKDKEPHDGGCGDTTVKEPGAAVAHALMHDGHLFSNSMTAGLEPEGNNPHVRKLEPGIAHEEDGKGGLSGLLPSFRCSKGM